MHAGELICTAAFITYDKEITVFKIRTIPCLCNSSSVARQKAGQYMANLLAELAEP